ncbi:hypothetical protein FB45DRAFT_1059931 [Roridomyces roridus]|uniref:Uncharacterized protein n=1 Tax=Roridomyces roridus TaxID=1738132 RepID=A0AAD7BPV8_9AGAR|nr:hypothetical protein FB45DRAFT_1059931 [Roridomyces roridus]
MASPSTVVVLGPSPEAFFVGHGRRYFVEGMPSSSFTSHATSDLNIGTTLWTRRVVSYTVYFNSDMHEDVRKHLTGGGAKFLSFPDSDDPAHYFLKGRNSGAWNAVLPNYYVDRLNSMQNEIKDFDVGITGMLFGQGRTNIVMFQAGFIADLDDRYVDGEDHPLLKPNDIFFFQVLNEFSDPPGWCIEYGSTLCFYDSRYFFLKFKRPGSSEIQMRWRLPAAAAEKLEAPREEAKTPAEQMALISESQQQMILAQARMNMEMAQTQALADVINRGAASFAALAHHGRVVYYDY